jgi:uncharacterized membrane protein
VPVEGLRLKAADLSAIDPAGLVSRLENRVYRLEASKQEALEGIERARSEIAHARASLGQAFPQAAQLAEARDRAREIDEQLDQMVAPPQGEAEPDRPAVPGISAALAIADRVAQGDWRDQVIQSEASGWMPVAGVDSAQKLSRPSTTGLRQAAKDHRNAFRIRKQGRKERRQHLM